MLLIQSLGIDNLENSKLSISAISKKISNDLFEKKIGLLSDKTIQKFIKNQYGSSTPSQTTLNILSAYVGYEKATSL